MDMSQHPVDVTQAEVDATQAEADQKETRRATLIVLTLLAALGGVVASGLTFGAVGLALPAIASVPFVFIIMVLISLG